jgi:hypothetical protein
MSATIESKIRTREFARVLGPFLVLVPGIIIVRAPDIESILRSFFQNDVIVWFAGAFLLFCGLLIISYHQYWSSAAAIIISLFGWFLALRGLVLLAVPQLIKRGAYASMKLLPAVRAGFSVLVLAGLWLTYVGWFVKPPEKTPEE